MKKLKYFSGLVILTLIILSGLPGIAQTLDDYIKQREADFSRFKNEQQQFVQQKQQQYDEYVKQRDKEFGDYLSQRWNDYQLFAAKRLEGKPKPPNAPVHEPRQEVIPPRILPVKAPELVVKPPTVPEARTPLAQKIEPEYFPTKNVSFDFYGNKVMLAYDPALNASLPSSINNFTISSFWRQASKSNYNHFINQLSVYRQRMNLNDWGYFLLVKQVSDALYPHSANGAVMCNWFLMTRSGYRAKVAYFDNRAMLMLPVMQEIYNVNFQNFDGINYYLIGADATKIYTYDKDFPDAPRIIDLNIYRPMNLGDSVAKRDVAFSYQGSEHKLNFKYCINTINFFSDYPQSQINVYFNSTVSLVAKESLAESLSPVLRGMNELEATNYLLLFTQSAFEYKTDPQQFGREKFLFTEEVLHYPYSDCEDRSVLFAYLARELLNLKVVALEYDDHVATAVKFNGEVNGDHIIYGGQKYLICDPTFINAPVGMAMKEYASVAAKVLDLDNSRYYSRLGDRIWDIIYASGCSRGGNKNDLVFDIHENAYVVGTFKGQTKLGNTTLSALNETRGAFIAKFDKQGNLVWVRQPDLQENAVAYDAALDNQQNVYIAGTFRDVLLFGNTQLKASQNADVFIAKYNPEGALLWAQKASIDTLAPSLNFIFAAKYDKNGRHLKTDTYCEMPEFQNYGIAFHNESILLTGSTYSNNDLRSTALSFDSTKKFDLVKSLKEESDRLLALNYDPAIAGLFAAINHIKINNLVIPGNAAIEALDKYNPDFKKTAPNVYKSISRISFMKNDEGIIFITTDNEKPVSIDYLKINNNASVKVTEFKNGNAQLDILKGIGVGKAFIWYSLNYVQLFKETGDLLFDYASDNSQRFYNLRKDILY